MSDIAFHTPSAGPFGALAARLQAADLVREAEMAAKESAESAVTAEKANWKRSKRATPAVA